MIYSDRHCSYFLKEYFFTIEGKFRIQSNILCVDLSAFQFLFTCLSYFSSMRLEKQELHGLELGYHL